MMSAARPAHVLIDGDPGDMHALMAEPGTVCAMTMDAHAPAGRFVWAALLAAGAGTSSWLLAQESMSAALGTPPDLRPACAQALDQGRIKLLRHRLSEPGARELDALLAELDHFGIAAGSLLLIDCGARWFDPSLAPAPHLTPLGLLQQWALRRQIAVVLLYTVGPGMARDHAARLLRAVPRLAGIGRISQAPATLQARHKVGHEVGAQAFAGAHVDHATALPNSADYDHATAAVSSYCNLLYWFAGSTLLTDATIALALTPAGRLRVDQAAHGGSDDTVTTAMPSHSADDRDAVIVLRSALAGSGGAPPHWTLCDTLDEVLAACEGARAATVILSFERTTPHDLLMHAVFRLRRQAGNRLKILIRELHVRLRYNEEALLAQLGANLIVPMEVSYARLLSMMEMLQSQVFAGVLPATYEQALADGLPQQAAGYLAPQAFAKSVSRALARSRALAIDNVLVRLTIAGGLTPLDALRHCSVKRAGDVFSGDRKSVLVFLFACREIDATQTLERIFALPVGELFSSEHRYISNLAASSAIEDFAQRAASGRMPDLSEALQQIEILRSPVVPATFGGTIIAASAGPAGTLGSARASIPAPTRAPLRLRQAGGA